MWNNRPSYFLLIQIRRRKVNLTLPVPLFVLQDILTALHDLALLWNSLFPRQPLPIVITTLCLELFQDLRQFGSWPLVEVSDGESHISLHFK